MDNTQPVRIAIGSNGLGTIEVDGRPLERVTGFEIESKAANTPRLTLHLSMLGGVDADMRPTILIPDGTVRTLIALGWTPPPGTLEALEAGERYVSLPEPPA